MRQGKDGEEAFLRGVPRLEVGRGRAQHEHGVFARRPEPGYFLGLVGHVIFLLERGVVLFVDDDESERGQRQEESRARPHDEAGRLLHGQPAEDGFPAHLALVAVIKNDFRVGEGAGRVAAQLVGDGHFRRQQEHAFPQGKGLARSRQIDGRLARARDAVQKPLGRFAASERFCDVGRCLFLIVVEFERAVRGRQEGLVYGLGTVAGVVAFNAQKSEGRQPVHCLRAFAAQRADEGAAVYGAVHGQVFEALDLLYGVRAHGPGRAAGEDAALCLRGVLARRDHVRAA